MKQKIFSTGEKCNHVWFAFHGVFSAFFTICAIIMCVELYRFSVQYSMGTANCLLMWLTILPIALAPLALMRYDCEDGTEQTKIW